MLPRRQLLAGLGAAAALRLLPAAAQQPPPNAGFGFEQVKALAATLAGRPFEEPGSPLPAGLRDVGYDRYRDFRYRPARALWRGDRLFQVQFFHRGFLYERKVAVNVLVDGQPVPVPYSADLFDFGPGGTPEGLSDSLGFAGFRLHYPLHHPEPVDEVAVFLGASYFRVLGRNMHWGLSARGLAIDVAQPTGEEFPFFREFWLERPAHDATSIRLYALLDSPGVAGAYALTLRPGTVTLVEAAAVLYPRKAIARLGIAPLTSMFLHGENSAKTPDDFRPEVHDSDGLLLHGHSGEWIWRPLVNGEALRVSAFGDDGIRGFGLVQRDRRFHSYLDAEAEYQRRPSLWVEPVGDWGRGAIELVEIPTATEFNDNIVAYWVSAEAVQAGKPIERRYRLLATLDSDWLSPNGRVMATRWGTAATPGSARGARGRTAAILFDGGELASLAADQPVEAVVSATTGQLGKAQVRKIDGAGWLVAFPFAPDGGKPSDLRCFLRLRDAVLTETWTYLWTA